MHGVDAVFAIQELVHAALPVPNSVVITHLMYQLPSTGETRQKAQEKGYQRLQHKSTSGKDKRGNKITTRLLGKAKHIIIV